MSELARTEDTPATGDAPEPPLTREQAAALAAVLERIACHVTGSSRDDPATAYMRLGFRPAEVKALTSITAP